MNLSRLSCSPRSLPSRLALATWSIADPSFNHAVDATPGNLLGYPGAVIADELMQLLGLGVLFAIAIPAAWAARLLGHQPVFRPIRSVFVFVIAVFIGAGFMSALPTPANWALAAGLGGNAGDIPITPEQAIRNLRIL